MGRSSTKNSMFFEPQNVPGTRYFKTDHQCMKNLHLKCIINGNLVAITSVAGGYGREAISRWAIFVIFSKKQCHAI